MIKPGDVISYIEMCSQEGTNLQRGMNFHLHGEYSVVLMSQRHGAPYADKVEGGGRTLIYEGHDVAKARSDIDPKAVDQPKKNPSGSLTENGLFFEAAERYKNCKRPPERIRVYEKIKAGIWVYNGFFNLVDAWQELSNGRRVFKFKLQMIDDKAYIETQDELEHNRLIPAQVKLEVWKRDKGQCVLCGSKKNLHFDHIIPYSKGGSSLVPDNIQLLCAKHNLSKRDKIE